MPNINTYEPMELLETPEMAEKIDGIAEKLEHEYWVSPEYNELQEEGVDVGRLIFYGLAIESYRKHFTSIPEVKRYFTERDQKSTLSKPPHVDLPLETLETITPKDETAEKVIVDLSEDSLIKAKVIASLYDVTLAQALRLSAKQYFDDTQK